jgi:hypothetical protein
MKSKWLYSATIGVHRSINGTVADMVLPVVHNVSESGTELEIVATRKSQQGEVLSW